jgi:bifunctional non-homologous end joining protein LigD
MRTLWLNASFAGVVDDAESYGGMRKAKLEKYEALRNFSISPEPKGTRGKDRELKPGQRARFVIQKHAAKRLHYDLRLEIGGALRSWALPKEPISDPKIKRLAIEVEDHPLGYLQFAGAIPHGQYGAGEVEIWDRGAFRLDGHGDAQSQLRQGKLEFTLFGERLQGSFALVRSARVSKQPEWLLLALERPALPWSGAIVPMQPAAVDQLPSGGGWNWEVKWDGVRAICIIENGQTKFQARSGAIYAREFPELGGIAKQVAASSAVIDGEIVVLAEDGVPRFDLIQQRLKTPRRNHAPRNGPLSAQERLIYCAFDLLWKDGRDYRQEPLELRQAALMGCVSPNAWIQAVGPIHGDGSAVLKAIREKGYEGIVAKRKDSVYVEGRTDQWVKLKLQGRQSFAIAGWLPGKREGFSALALASREKEGLRWRGNVGTGFSAAAIRDISAKLAMLKARTAPSGDWPVGMLPARPGLECEVRFAGWTASGKLRAPVFLKLSEDVRDEKLSRSPGKAFHAISNPEKLYFPKDGFRKKDIAAYYERIAPVLLPYLKDRPISLRRFPDGIHGKSFFQKHPAAQTRYRAPTAVIPEDGGRVFLCPDVDSLLYYVNLGCIDFHAWTSRMQAPRRPDYYLADLDANGCPFAKVIEGAFAVRAIVEETGLATYVKTSGGDGIHVMIEPVPGKDFDYGRQLVDEVAKLCERRFPTLFTSVRSLRARPKGKLYFDKAQIGYGKTIASPYSLRPYDGLAVSTPLEWEELRSIRAPAQWNVRSIFERLEKFGDPLAPLAAKWRALRGR